MYNACEMILMIFLTFRRFGGAYFWSMVIASLGIIPYSIGFILRFLYLTAGNLSWLPMVLLTIGWYLMITGQAFVLYSRLHLVVSGPRGERLITFARWMILTNVLVLHIPTTVLTFGSNGSIMADVFQEGYNVMEKVQMTGFALQECLLSLCFVLEAVKLLRTSLRPAPRKIMRQLLAINLVIIIMDIGLVSMEYASLYVLEAGTKGTVYSIKLKLEFVILGQLVKFVGDTKPREGQQVRQGQQDQQSHHGQHQDSVGFITSHDMTVDIAAMDMREFVDVDRITTDLSRPTYLRRTTTMPDKKWEADISRFEHARDASSLSICEEPVPLRPQLKTETSAVIASSSRQSSNLD